MPYPARHPGTAIGRAPSALAISGYGDASLLCAGKLVERLYAQGLLDDRQRRNEAAACARFSHALAIDLSLGAERDAIRCREALRIR